MPTKTVPCFDAFEERAAILEYDGGHSRYISELAAAKAQGFPTADHIKHAFVKDADGLCCCPLCVGGAL